MRFTALELLTISGALASEIAKAEEQFRAGKTWGFRLRRLEALRRKVRDMMHAAETTEEARDRQTEMEEADADVAA